MAEQSWFDGGAAGESRGSFFPAGAVAPPPPAPGFEGVYELRPLTTGEVLDRTFFLYRNHFWLFVGISAVAAAVSTVSSLGNLIWLHFARASAVSPFSAGKILYSVVASLLYLVVYSVSQAATVAAVSEIYLQRATSLGQAFDAVRGRWLRFFGIALWQTWSGMWLFVVLAAPAVAGVAFLRAKMGVGAIALLGLVAFVSGLGGLVYGVIAYIRNSLAVPAEVMEGLPLRGAMRRSKTLAAGTKGRIFLLFLFLAALYLVAVAVESPLTFLIVRHRGVGVVAFQAGLMFLNFVVASVVAPVGAIGLCLFYIDQRVRKEGFDLQVLLERAAGGTSPGDDAGYAVGPV